MPAKKGLLERLNEGPVIGDGGFVFALEKRGYVKAGPWTPECLIENPEAVIQLHREFSRAGADIVQALTFYGSDDKLENRGNAAKNKYTGRAINAKAAELAKTAAEEYGGLTLGGVCQCPSYLSGKSKTEVQKEFRKQIEVFNEAQLDFVLAEYFEHIEEMEWAIEVLKESKKPVAATMCIGPEGDLHGVSAEDCAVRMANAGADVIGVNCHFDPFVCIETIKIMKKALEAENLLDGVHLMIQPLAYFTPDAGKQGFIDLPEFPFALESRICTRFDIQRYAREAYDLGVRYIGGCCGFEPYHIRAISEELSSERGGKLGPASEKHDQWGAGLKMHTKPWVRARANKNYWQEVKPASGRPYCPSMSKPDNWGVTKGCKELIQQSEATTEDEISNLIKQAKKKL